MLLVSGGLLVSAGLELRSFPDCAGSSPPMLVSILAGPFCAWSRGSFLLGSVARGEPASGSAFSNSRSLNTNYLGVFGRSSVNPFGWYGVAAAREAKQLVLHVVNQHRPGRSEFVNVQALASVLFDQVKLLCPVSDLRDFP